MCVISAWHFPASWRVGGPLVVVSTLGPLFTTFCAYTEKSPATPMAAARLFISDKFIEDTLRIVLAYCCLQF